GMDIWFSRRRSRRVEPVYVGCRPEINPTWSPDGKRMVFGSVRGRTSQHKSGTRVQSRVLACTHDVLSGTPFDQHAWGRSGQP
ncbi:MAG: hypothetical protein DMG17_00700, partial [Acidobacteria bacterium]